MLKQGLVVELDRANLNKFETTACVHYIIKGGVDELA